MKPSLKRYGWLLLGASALSAPAVAGAQTLYSFSSEQGDFIGAGQTKVYTPENATFQLSGNNQQLTLRVSTAQEWWYVNLAAPRGQTFVPGRYYEAERASFRTGRSPGIDVSGNGRGCNETWGSVYIQQIEANAQGQILSLEASFIQRCERLQAPALAGVVRYNAPALSLKLDSDVGDYIGQGMKKHYAGDTSTFALTGDASRLNYTASGQRDSWRATIAPPSGKKLQPGTVYATTRFADAQNAGLDFGGNGRGCNASSGLLTIEDIGFDPVTNAVNRLYAEFEQYCENRPQALRGAIRYKY